MARSPGFGSNSSNYIALLRLAFATPTPNGLSSLDKLSRWPIIQKVRRHGINSAPTACKHSVSVSISLPSSGFFSPFPHGTCSLSVAREYLGLEGGPPMFKQDFTCPALLKDSKAFYLYRAITYYCQPFHVVLVVTLKPLAWSAFARHY